MSALDPEELSLSGTERSGPDSSHSRISFRACAMTLSTVKPYFSSSASAGAEAPNRPTPIMSPPGVVDQDRHAGDACHADRMLLVVVPGSPPA